MQISNKQNMFNSGENPDKISIRVRNQFSNKVEIEFKRWFEKELESKFNTESSSEIDFKIRFNSEFRKNSIKYFNIDFEIRVVQNQVSNCV